MGSIRVLEDEVINKIAAGEVVERPASVVKELVENAIDAGAREISVTLEQGGTRLIAVTDDGGGMDPEDAKRALIRHATSKIRSADDLFSVGTMGFRGEALASIAAVSRFSLATVSAERGESGEGIKLLVEDGIHPDERPYSGPRGTTLTVADLFHTVPARAKFLKAAATEYGQCLELIQAFALSHPDLSFVLTHNGRETLSVRAVDSGRSLEERLRERAADVFGEEKVRDLIFVEDRDRYGRVEGLVSPPGVEKPGSKWIHTFLNGRLVRDKTLRYGVLRGYHSHLLKGRYPMAILHLTVDPALVDVNVHPAKTEVRFQYPGEVQTLLAQTIRKSLRQGAWAEPSFEPARTVPSAPSSPSYQGGFSSRVRSFEASSSAASFGGGGSPARPKAPAVPVFDKEGLDRFLALEEESTPANGGPLAVGEDIGSDTEKSVPWRELDFVGAFARCYLFFADDTKLLVVDQHAFHERVLYERLIRDEDLLNQSQRLLVPEAVTLSPTEASMLKERCGALKSRGFDLEFPDETGTVELRAVPSLLAGRDPESLLRDLAVPEEASEPSESNASLTRLILATVACHGAVRAGEELGEGELKQLLREAETVDFYHNCPHGRRVFRWWSVGQVARWFDR